MADAHAIAQHDPEPDGHALAERYPERDRHRLAHGLTRAHGHTVAGQHSRGNRLAAHANPDTGRSPALADAYAAAPGLAHSTSDGHPNRSRHARAAM